MEQLIKFLKTKQGSIALSIILGLGIASLFRQACKEPDCIVVKSYDPETVRKTTYRNNGKCYRFDPFVVKCS